MVHGSAYSLPRPVLLLLLLSLLSCLPAPAFALDRELRIVTVEQGACGRMDGGRLAGFCFELGNALAREAGLRADNRLVPLARGMEEVATDKADMIIALSEDAIVGLVEDIGPVQSFIMVAWARVGTPLRDARDLAGKTVAVVRGARQEFDRAKELRFIPFPCKNHELGFKMLLAGRVDAVLGSLQGLAEIATRIGLDRRFLGRPLALDRDFMHVYVSLSVPEAVRGRLRKALNRLIEDGTVARLRERYPI
jgi:polar amino acid transport system substrate-binding protein